MKKPIESCLCLITIMNCIIPALYVKSEDRYYCLTDYMSGIVGDYYEPTDSTVSLVRVCNSFTDLYEQLEINVGSRNITEYSKPRINKHIRSFSKGNTKQFSNAYDLGYNSVQSPQSVCNNPYSKGTSDYSEYESGYIQAMRDNYWTPNIKQNSKSSDAREAVCGYVADQLNIHGAIANGNDPHNGPYCCIEDGVGNRVCVTTSKVDGSCSILIDYKNTQLIPVGYVNTKESNWKATASSLIEDALEKWKLK